MSDDDTGHWRTLRSDSGLWCELFDHGAIRRIGHRDDLLNLFVGNAVEGGPAGIWLRRRLGDGSVEPHALVGPASGARWRVGGDRASAVGRAGDVCWRIELRLASSAPAWFWHLQLDNTGDAAETVDVVLVHDIALTSYGALRLNEHYVSHYVDLQPLRHADRGWVVAARQNLAVGPAPGRHPWAVIGSLRDGVSYATDALQWTGIAARDGSPPAGLVGRLPGRRLQHEHALVAIEDAPLTLQPGAVATLGFFGRIEADHPAASSDADLSIVDATLALPAAISPASPAVDSLPTPLPPTPTTLFTTAQWLPTSDLDPDQITARYGDELRHAEHDAGGRLLSFFRGESGHVVLRAKELLVLRPHGHILRSGRHETPDETSLTSTVYMGGVFHSLLTQGHVGINRLLSTSHGYLGQFRSHGQRLFVDCGDGWRQLGLPSAFEIDADRCRWIYRHAGGVFTVTAGAEHDAHAMTLAVDVEAGAPLKLLVSHHVALAGDDGSAPGAACWSVDGDVVRIVAPPDSELARRFPAGSFTVAADAGSRFAGVGGDELLHDGGAAIGEPFVVIEAMAAPRFALRIAGHLVDDTTPVEAGPPLPAIDLVPADGDGDGDSDSDGDGGGAAGDVARLGEMLPWLRHDALVHFLAPRGLEQYSGGGWGTRDVCQGPLEMLLAFGRTAPVRDLLLRTFAAQNDDGDWPQWFMFFDRDRAIRAGDSHGDIVLWPLLALAQYLDASGDAGLLAAPVVSHGGATLTVWQCAQRALALTVSRRIAGTQLAAYWHGDWNDALQPADPVLRERLCSAWTVTLHHQMLESLSGALRRLGREADAAPLVADAAGVLADFRRLLVRDGVVAGYALFADDDTAGAGRAAPELLLHPRDTRTGIRYSLLPMMHAVLAGMLSPDEARGQIALIGSRLLGPDGARLFDAPMPYRGGPERLFQRAESSAHFGREIGVMYMHAHLRYAQMLAHVGDGDGFLAALSRAHPIGLQRHVPGAAPRQANCYYSSSDAAFADRYEAAADYGRVADGSVAFEGGWRIYSSGPGIALALVVRHLVGITIEHDRIAVDPVLPPSLDGLVVATELAGHRIELVYRIGAAGHGTRSVAVNGRMLDFDRLANPYRTGAAAVDRRDFDAACVDGVNRVEITIG